jgi:peroxidase
LSAEREDDASNEDGGSLENPAEPIVCDTGNVLPNVRLVSRTFHTDSDVPSNRAQLFTMFGQFVCHDLLFTATQSKVPNCCASDKRTDFVNCLPIIVPAGDSFFNTSQCIDFRRSTIFCEQPEEERRHINQLTAYFDAGNIYGSDVQTAAALRELSGGRLKVEEPYDLLPLLTLSGNVTRFTAGETRATENPALTTIHTVFLREHNRIAKIISQRNASLTDSEIYNRARRIVTAEFQSIVYGQFLPLLIGSKSLIGRGNSSTRYNPNMDPSITNEFSAAALRFGHTTVNGFFNQNDPLTGELFDGYLLRTSNNNVTIYSSDSDRSMTSIAKGMTLQAGQNFDNFMTRELTDFLYAATANNNLKFGSDLAARNIQRGRDNGLSGWVHYRKHCTGEAPTGWQSKPEDISAENWAKLKSLYVSVADIDLFTGSLAEMPVPSGTVGITSKCIIEQQFRNLMSGDRYFFTHKGNVGAQFNRRQISALKNVTMFDILCLNTNIAELQQRVFEVPSGLMNPSVSCQSAKGIDISLFI